MTFYSFKHPITPFLLLLLLLLLLIPSQYAVAQSSPDTRDPYGYARVTPSMAIIIVVLIGALFFMGFFSIYIRHCYDSNGGTSIRNLPNGGRRAAAARGLDPAVIETFPTLVYAEVKGLKIGKGALECAVCLCEFEDDETLRLIPKCDHVFHPDCIDAWLVSHTTCPVCRANLTPQPGDPPPQVTESTPELTENDTVVIELEEPQTQVCEHEEEEVTAREPEVISANQMLNRNRTRRSRSGRPRRFPRSHSTGHSLVQPGENTERFTLRLPVEVRKQIMKRELNRTMSMVVFSRERSSRSGYKSGGGGGGGGGGEGSSRGKHRRLERMDQGAKSDRWVLPFLTRASSFLTRASSSVRSPKVAADNGGGEGTSSTSSRPVGQDTVETGRPPV